MSKIHKYILAPVLALLLLLSCLFVGCSNNNSNIPKPSDLVVTPEALFQKVADYAVKNGEKQSNNSYYIETHRTNGINTVTTHGFRYNTDKDIITLTTTIETTLYIPNKFDGIEIPRLKDYTNHIYTTSGMVRYPDYSQLPEIPYVYADWSTSFTRDTTILKLDKPLEMTTPAHWKDLCYKEIKLGISSEITYFSSYISKIIYNENVMGPFRMWYAEKLGLPTKINDIDKT